MKIDYYHAEKALTTKSFELATDFLYTELGEYGDPKISIAKAIDYALDASPHKGGLVALAYQDEQLVAATVINRTGMGDYIPENILVYIAVHHDCRGRGIGRKFLTSVLEQVEGDIALHVEPQNPAIKLYESMGFCNKYLEMRLIRKTD